MSGSPVEVLVVLGEGEQEEVVFSGTLPGSRKGYGWEILTLFGVGTYGEAGSEDIFGER